MAEANGAQAAARLRDYLEGRAAHPFLPAGHGPPAEPPPAEPPPGAGDAWEPPAGLPPGNWRGAKAEGAATGTAPGAPPWPDPIPASQLRRQDAARKWLWHGYLARGQVTLLSALWKAGKSTLLAHLLRALGGDGLFCDLRVTPARALYITEEGESRWAERRDALGLQDHVHFLIRPFVQKASWADWVAFLGHVRRVREAGAYDLVVMDTLTNLWPVRQENDAGEVQAALQPLHSLGEDVATLLVHHLKKMDGQQATGSRGSGALTSFVDTIIELRRFDAADRKDCRRVLTAYGRDDDTYDELVIELAGQGYLAHGDRNQAQAHTIAEVLDAILPIRPPGLTWAEIAEAWPQDAMPRKQAVLAALDQGLEAARYSRQGSGKKGSPHAYWRPPQLSVSVPTIRTGTETESAAGTEDPFPD